MMGMVQSANDVHLGLHIPSHHRAISSAERLRWSHSRLSRKTRGKGKGFHKRHLFPQIRARTVTSTCEEGCTYLRGRLHVLARTDARTCGERCTYLQGRLHVLAWRMQCTAMTDAVQCRGGCSALQERLQCTASKTGSLWRSPTDFLKSL